MEQNTKLILVQRESDGRFGSFSKEVTFEGLALIIHNISTKNLLPNFYPVVESYNKLLLESFNNSLKKRDLEELWAQYNAVFNLWQDSKSYEIEAIRTAQNIQVLIQANNFIDKLHNVLNESVKDFKFLSVAHLPQSSDLALQNALRDYWDKKLQIANQIKSNCNFYIGSFLCLVHSKASLELKSFKKDVVIGRRAEYLYEIIQKLYGSIVSYDFNNQKLQNDSIIRTLVLDRYQEIDSFLRALPVIPSADALRLAYFDQETVNQSYEQDGQQYKKVSWSSFWPQQLECARIFKDLVLIIQPIIELVDRLKNGEIEWDSNSEGVDQCMAILQGKGF